MSNVRACEVCRRWIEPVRIEADRHTVLCAECAEKINKHGGEYFRTVKEERTSKTTSIRQGYGSAEIHKTRNQEALEKLRAEHLDEQQGHKG